MSATAGRSTRQEGTAPRGRIRPAVLLATALLSMASPALSAQTLQPLHTAVATTAVQQQQVRLAAAETGAVYGIDAGAAATGRQLVSVEPLPVSAEAVNGRRTLMEPQVKGTGTARAEAVRKALAGAEITQQSLGSTRQGLVGAMTAYGIDDAVAEKAVNFHLQRVAQAEKQQQPGQAIFVGHVLQGTELDLVTRTDSSGATITEIRGQGLPFQQLNWDRAMAAPAEKGADASDYGEATAMLLQRAGLTRGAAGRALAALQTRFDSAVTQAAPGQSVAVASDALAAPFGNTRIVIGLSRDGTTHYETQLQRPNATTWHTVGGYDMSAPPPAAQAVRPATASLTR